MINMLIRQFGGKNFTVYRKETTIVLENGGSRTVYEPVGSVYACVQSAGGFGLKTLEGDFTVADFVMYHKTPLMLHDRVKVFDDIYEIRAIAPFSARFMEFYKSYLVKIG